jgi:hypothetical protein
VFDAATVASGAKIKPGTRSTAKREALDAVPCRWPGPMPVARSAARPSTGGTVASGARIKAAPCRCAGTEAGGAPALHWLRVRNTPGRPIPHLVSSSRRPLQATFRLADHAHKTIDMVRKSRLNVLRLVGTQP